MVLSSTTSASTTFFYSFHYWVPVFLGRGRIGGWFAGIFGEATGRP